MSKTKPLPARTKTGSARDLIPGFPEAVRAAREVSGLTQDQAAERCGLPRGTIPQLENGRRGPSLRTALALHAGIGLDLHALAPKLS